MADVIEKERDPNAALAWIIAERNGDVTPKCVGDGFVLNATALDFPDGIRLAQAGRNSRDFHDFWKLFGRLRKVTIKDPGTALPYNFFRSLSADEVEIPSSMRCQCAFAKSGVKHAVIRCVPGSEGELRQAFCSCLGLESATFVGTGLRSVQEGMFYGCSLLRSVCLPDGLNTIKHEAFKGCTQLDDVDFPNSLSVVQTLAFSECFSIKKIDLHGAYSGNSSFMRCTDLTCAENLGDVGEQAFCGCASLGVVSFAEGKCERICGGAFSSCQSLKSVTLPKSVKRVGQGAFSFSGLRAVRLLKPDPRVFEGGPFNYCTHINTIVLPRSPDDARALARAMGIGGQELYFLYEEGGGRACKMAKMFAKLAKYGVGANVGRTGVVFDFQACGGLNPDLAEIVISAAQEEFGDGCQIVMTDCNGSALESVQRLEDVKQMLFKF